MVIHLRVWTLRRIVKLPVSPYNFTSSFIKDPYRSALQPFHCHQILPIFIDIKLKSSKSKPSNPDMSKRQATLGSFWGKASASDKSEQATTSHSNQPASPAGPKKEKSLESFWEKPKTSIQAASGDSSSPVPDLSSQKENKNTIEKKVEKDMKASPKRSRSRSPSSKSATPKRHKKDDSSSMSQTNAVASTTTSKEAKATTAKDIPYSVLCETFEKIEATTKRLEILAHLTKCFEYVIETCPSALVNCVYLCLNRIGPEYEAKELGVGETLLMKAVANATGRNLQAVKNDVRQMGDLGSVAQASKGAQKLMFAPKALTVGSVFKTLVDIAHFTGSSSQQRKVDTIQKLMASGKGSEPKYIIRSLEGKLRIGLAEQSVLVALSHAAANYELRDRKISPEKKTAILAKATATVKQVYSEIPNYDKIIDALLKYGFEKLPDHCTLTPGIPLKPMLAHPTKSITEVLDRFEGMNFICEYKYDGERAQIHMMENGKVCVFSRNSENLSEKYPDIISRMPRVPKEGVKSFVLDCEAVAWDREKKCILPFQVLSTRKRKDVTEGSVQVQVCVFAFDLLYLNGEPLVTQPLRKRRELLEQSFQEISGEFMIAKSMISNELDAIQHFLDDSVQGNCEGLMVKTLDEEASYEPSKRSRNWLKVKKDYIDGVGDSLDLVVIGGYIGRGKRTGWYGGYLLACYDDQREEYQSICKIGTGFSEEQLKEHAEFFKAHIIEKPRPYYQVTESPNITPDVWFDPVQVWEVKTADLSISPVHKAAMGIVDPNKGISLRFPRFIRVRDDKSPEQATTARQVAEFYQSQSVVSNMKANGSGSGATGVDDDFEY